MEERNDKEWKIEVKMYKEWYKGISSSEKEKEKKK